MKTIRTMKRITLVLSFMIILLLISCNVFAAGKSSGPKNSKEALQMAGKNNQYLFLLFYKEKNDITQAFEVEMRNFIKKSKEKIVIYRAVTTEVKESEMTMLYANDISNPALVVFASNGAVTGKFPEKVTGAQLKECFVTDLHMKILKVLQDRKVALVLLQNKRTKYNKEIDDAAKDFTTRLKFAVAIKADPDDPVNRDFVVKQCKLKPGFSEATAVLVEQIGAIEGVYIGKSAKASLKKIADDFLKPDDDY